MLATVVLDTGNGRLATGNRKLLVLETGNRPLQTGDWRLATGNWELATGSSDIFVPSPGGQTISSLTTENPVSLDDPNEVVMATSVASRPVASRTRPIRGRSCRASNVHQRSSR